MSDAFLDEISGLVHVGANEGQERELYAARNLSVLWVEALPAVFSILQENLASFPRQSAVNGLVTDVAGQRHSFHVSSNGAASSSIYDFALHRDIWPEVHFTHDVELTSTTLDRIFADRGAAPGDFQALVMDTQGSELLVLKGAQNVLRGIRYIKTEAADFESYKGCTTVEELTNYLSGLGFSLVAKEAFAERPAGGKYYEMLFERPPSRLSHFWRRLFRSA